MSRRNVNYDAVNSAYNDAVTSTSKNTANYDVANSANNNATNNANYDAVTSANGDAAENAIATIHTEPRGNVVRLRKSPAIGGKDEIATRIDACMRRFALWSPEAVLQRRRATDAQTTFASMSIR